MSLSYFLVNFNTDADRFFFFWLATLLLFIMAIAMSLMLVLLMPNHQILMILFGISQNLWWCVKPEWHGAGHGGWGSWKLLWAPGLS